MRAGGKTTGDGSAVRAGGTTLVVGSVCQSRGVRHQVSGAGIRAVGKTPGVENRRQSRGCDTRCREQALDQTEKATNVRSRCQIRGRCEMRGQCVQVETQVSGQGLQALELEGTGAR